MAQTFQQLLKNVNFCLRLAECIVCLIGVIISIFEGGTVYYYYFVHGWFMISLAYLVAYFFEKPNVWLEVGLLIAYNFAALGVLYSFEIEDLVVAIIEILMVIDVIFLIINRNK